MYVGGYHTRDPLKKSRFYETGFFCWVCYTAHMEIKEQVALAPYTYLKIGGPARFFVEAETEEDVKEALLWARERSLPYYVLGAGSNILVADNGFFGLVIKITMRTLSFDGMCMNVDAGVPMALAASRSVAEERTGFEWAVGVPGTIGGSVYGNAGCFGGEMKDVVAEVTVLHTNKYTIQKLSNKECAFNYRESMFKMHPEYIILSATLQLAKGTGEELERARAHIKTSAALRVEEQDIGTQTAGSTFKGVSITEETIQRIRAYMPVWQKGVNTCWCNESRRGMFGAGFFIEQAGLKGMQIGGVSVSEKHANFLVNEGNATAEDVVMLIASIKEHVHRMFGVLLEEEIRYVGF
jgi:UDP-N-acetylmuramate dehydrogenase